MTDPQSLEGAGDGPIPELRLPDPRLLFTRRAERFAKLSKNHGMGEYLRLLGHLAAAQAVAAAALKLPQSKRRLPLERPFDAALHDRRPEWRGTLGTVLLEVARRARMPEEGKAALEMIAAMPPPELEALADAALENAVHGTDLAAGPFVAAGLQVYFATVAASLDPDAVAPGGRSCPVCGALPVAGVVLAEDEVRYLVCSLCATQWHHGRPQCVACGETRSLTSCAAEAGGGSSARAEACSACKTYTKFFHAQKDLHLEPLADDLATLELDALMAENGLTRRGVNLFLLSDEPDPDDG